MKNKKYAEMFFGSQIYCIENKFWATGAKTRNYTSQSLSNDFIQYLRTLTSMMTTIQIGNQVQLWLLSWPFPLLFDLHLRPSETPFEFSGANTVAGTL